MGAPSISRGVRHRRTQGFQLIELLVALCVFTLLGAAMLPAWSAAQRHIHHAQLRHSLISDLRRAQQEALRRGVAINLSPLPCAPSDAARDAKDWRCGWSLYIDHNDNAVEDSGDTRLRRTTLDGRTPIVSTRDALRYVPVGRTSNVQTFRIDDDGPSVTVSWVRIR